jgi:hypothetical protein
MHEGCRWRNLKEGNPSEDPGLDGSIILKWIVKRWDGWRGLDAVGSECG